MVEGVTQVGPSSDAGVRPLGSRYLLGDLFPGSAMGRMFRARVRGDDDEVVATLLPAHVAGRTEAVSRLIEERQFLRSISHPHLVPVVDVVVDRSELAVVSPFVDGPDLNAAVRWPCPAGRALRIMAQVADALAALHSVGVVHSDLSPSKIICRTGVDGRDDVRLAGFGPSRLAEVGLTGNVGSTGALPYAAPDVLLGERPTPASDVYSLGLILFELCSGRLPFEADSPLAATVAQLEEEIRRPEGMPEALWHLLGQVLDRDPLMRLGPAEAGPRMRALAPSMDRLQDVAMAEPVGDTSAAAPAGAGSDDASPPETIPVEVAPVEVAQVEVAGNPVGDASRPGSRRRSVLLLLAAIAVVVTALVGGLAAMRGRPADVELVSVTGASPSPSAAPPASPAAVAALTWDLLTGPRGTAAPPAVSPSGTSGSTGRSAATGSSRTGSRTTRTGSSTTSSTKAAPSTRAVPRATTTTTSRTTQSAPSGPRTPAPTPTWIATPTLTVTETGGGSVSATIGDVRSGGVAVSSLTLFGSPQPAFIPVRSGVSTYTRTLSGLSPGATYHFVARVCAAHGRCVDSAEVWVLISRAPDLGTGRLSSAPGGYLRLTWDPVSGTAPAGMSCRITVSGTVYSGPSYSVGLGAFDRFLFLRGRDSYRATKTCTWNGGSTSAQSNTLRIF